MSTNKVFLGNLSWKITTEDLIALLREEGYTFHSAKVILDRDTQRSRGFAFVEFETPEAAIEAIAELNGFVIDGRSLRAMEAAERSSRGESERDRKSYGGGSCDDRGHFDGGDRRREHHRSRQRDDKW